MLKRIHIIFFLLLAIKANAQLVDTAIMFKDVMNIDSLNKLSIGREESHKFFTECRMHNDIAFAGIDTFHFITYQGEIKVFIEYQNGKKIKAIGYYDNGKKYQESNFNGNALHGLNIVYFKNGNKKYQRYYESGEQIDPEIMWYEDGNLSQISEMDKHKGISWYRNGKLKGISVGVDSLMSIGYKNATLAKEYYENGQLMEDVIYNAGMETFLAYHDNGQKAWEGKIIDWAGYQVGKWLEWHKNGQLKRIYIFHDSIPNYRIGTWEWWDENGNLIKQDIYKDNELIETKEFLPKVKEKEKE